MSELPHEHSFVVDLPATGIAVERAGKAELHRQAGATSPLPTVIFVHGPVFGEGSVRPWDWPVYQGYGRLAASRGLVGITLDLRYPSLASWPAATEELVQLVGQIRSRPEVDGDRLALWAFSGGAVLVAPWLAESPPWLRCLALSYPFLLGRGPSDGPPVPWEAVRPGRPIVLTRVGRERPELQAAVEDFLERSKAVHASVELIDVPDGRHGFDFLDHTEQSRQAVVTAMAAVHRHLDTRSS